MRKVLTHDTEKLVKQWRKAPPVKWQLMATCLRPNADIDVFNQIQNDAVCLATMAEYIHIFKNTNDHAKAVKAANRRRKRVRRALGYSYPGAGEINF